MTHLRFALLTILLAAFCEELRAAGGVHFTLVGVRAYSDGDISGGGGPAWGVGVSASGKKWPVNIDSGWQHASNLDRYNVDGTDHVNGRVTWRFGGHFDLGVDVRGVFGASADLDGTSLGVGCTQLGFFLGYGW